MLQGIKSTYKNQQYFYILEMNNQKLKFLKIPFQQHQESTNYFRINFSVNGIETIGGYFLKNKSLLDTTHKNTFQINKISKCKK